MNFVILDKKEWKMKKTRNLWMILWPLMIIALLMNGCATLGGGGYKDDIPRLKADIYMFSKIATRITLAEAEMPTKDIEIIEKYLVALRDLLSVPGEPNFAGARVLVNAKLPQKYQIYGLTIIDVLERYLRAGELNIPEDQLVITAVISSGINGALATMQEFKKR